MFSCAFRGNEAWQKFVEYDTSHHDNRQVPISWAVNCPYRMARVRFSDHDQFEAKADRGQNSLGEGGLSTFEKNQLVVERI